jgi:nucleoside phosphorylase
MIAVTFALPAESSGFLRRLNKKSRSDQHGVSIVRGEIAARTIEVLHTGVGEKICRARIGKFLSATGLIRRGERNRQFDCLISAGFAGALTDQLHAGDLLFAENFSTVSLSQSPKSLSSLSIHTGNLLTVRSIIDSIEERQKIAHTTGAAAIDMETEFIARACAEHGIPLISLRAISDTPRERFPAPANVLFDMERQRTNAMKLSLHLLGHPTAIPGLIAFAKKIAQAKETLANAIINFLQRIN